MSRDGLVALVTRVLEVPETWPALTAISDRDEFAAALVDMAVEQGLEVTTEDVCDALVQRRREWLERWV